MTQDQRLLNYLEQYGKVNPLEAWKELGIYRLSAAVLRLRKLGYNIVTNRIDVKNKFNESCHVAEYHLVSDEPKPQGWYLRALSAIRGATDDLIEINGKPS